MQVNFNGDNTVTMKLEDFVKYFPSIGEQPIQQVSKPVQTISTDLETAVTNVLNQLGVSRASLGFRYLRESLIIAVENPTALDKMTKLLYPKVAEKFSTTPTRAERAIRYSIEVSWNKADLDFQFEVFGNSISLSKGKATNSEYVAAIADYLRLKVGNGGQANERF